MSIAVPAADDAPVAAQRDAGRAPARAIVIWLIACCALVFAMVVVGGVTRLTHAGLSITEWQPLTGAIPPTSDADWDDAFAKYQATPEYRDVNPGMTQAEFRRIYWWEYFHRLLGRAIGFAFLVPYLWFLIRRRIPAGYAWPLAAIFLLGGLQGAVGWLMVKSGLVDDPHVSQFRLTAHLGLAFAIFAAMLWTAMSLAYPQRADIAAPRLRATRRLAFGVAATVFAMVLTGGFVAGIRAGFAYNTFPLMQGRFVPPGILMLEPWWTNFFWNMATVQFDHRILAWALAFAVPTLWWRLRDADVTARARVGGTLLLTMIAIQVSLGIATLLNVVPLPLAAMHQAGAVLAFALALNVAHALR